eukprot:SAG22_NODE_1921_length_3308_cov_1.802431_5_plen_132_part_00
MTLLRPESLELARAGGALSGTPTLGTSSPCFLPANWCPGLASWGNHAGVVDELIPRSRVYTKFTNAGWNVFEDHGRGRGLPARNGFIGWMGLGGSAVMFQPALNLGPPARPPARPSARWTHHPFPASCRLD